MESSDREKKIRVLVVDDHPLAVKGLGRIIARESDMEVCGESGDVSDALAKVIELRPDVATVDLNLGSESGFDLIRQMREMAPALKILVVSMHEEHWCSEGAVAAGAHGYVTKSTAGNVLVSSIRKLIRSKNPVIRPEMTAPLQPLDFNQTTTRRSMTRFASQLCTAAAVAVTCGYSVAQAAILTTVPMQGGMAMPMVTYHADHGELHVMMPAEVPQLTPLLISNPTDGFDPADPWYDDLDPSRQGKSFSRRYGFVMDAMSDPLPANTAIWLRKLSGPPELGFYRYSGNAPKAWQPIFGTAGTTNALLWNGMMFHPGVAAPAGTNPITATFEAYLVNTQTGAEVAGTSSGPLVFDFTNLADGRPALGIAPRIVVAWPADAATWGLESADTMPSSNWTPVTNAPVMVNGQPCVILDGGTGNKYFRMRRLP